MKDYESNEEKNLSLDERFNETKQDLEGSLIDPLFYSTNCYHCLLSPVEIYNKTKQESDKLDKAIIETFLKKPQFSENKGNEINSNPDETTNSQKKSQNNYQKIEIVIENIESNINNLQEVEENKKLFNVEHNYLNSNRNSFNNEDKVILSGHKKRGPKPNLLNKKRKKNEREDNIVSKVQVHCINSIINLINSKLESIPEFKNCKLLKLEHSFTRKNTWNDIESIKKLSIGDIIQKYISSIYSKHEKNHNKILYEKISSNTTINYLTSMKYVNYFRDIYYPSNREYMPNKDGLDIKIEIPIYIKLFNDLIKKDKKFGTFIFKKCIEECLLYERLFKVKHPH